MSSSISLSASVLAGNSKPPTSGKFLVSTVSGDTYLLDYDNEFVVKNGLDRGAGVDLEQKLAAHSLTANQVAIRFDKLPSWSYAFSFASVCEVGKEAYLLLFSKVTANMSHMTSEVVDIQRVA